MIAELLREPPETVADLLHFLTGYDDGAAFDDDAGHDNSSPDYWRRITSMAASGISLHEEDEWKLKAMIASRFHAARPLLKLHCVHVTRISGAGADRHLEALDRHLTAGTLPLGAGTYDGEERAVPFLKKQSDRSCVDFLFPHALNEEFKAYKTRHKLHELASGSGFASRGPRQVKDGYMPRQWPSTDHNVGHLTSFAKVHGGCADLILELPGSIIPNRPSVRPVFFADPMGFAVRHVIVQPSDPRQAEGISEVLTKARGHAPIRKLPRSNDKVVDIGPLSKWSGGMGDQDLEDIAGLVGGDVIRIQCMEEGFSPALEDALQELHDSAPGKPVWAHWLALRKADVLFHSGEMLFSAWPPALDFMCYEAPTRENGYMPGMATDERSYQNFREALWLHRQFWLNFRRAPTAEDFDDVPGRQDIPALASDAPAFAMSPTF